MKRGLGFFQWCPETGQLTETWDIPSEHQETLFSVKGG